MVFQQRESATSAAAAAEQARDLSCAAIAFAAFETFNFSKETHDVLEQGQESKGRSIALLPHSSIQGSYSKERSGGVVPFFSICFAVTFTVHGYRWTMLRNMSLDQMAKCRSI